MKSGILPLFPLLLHVAGRAHARNTRWCVQRSRSADGLRRLMALDIYFKPQRVNFVYWAKPQACARLHLRCVTLTPPLGGEAAEITLTSSHPASRLSLIHVQLFIIGLMQWQDLEETKPSFKSVVTQHQHPPLPSQPASAGSQQLQLSILRSM